MGAPVTDQGHKKSVAQRLTDRAKELETFAVPELDGEAITLMRDAAGEIERLRAKIAALHGWSCESDGCARDIDDADAKGYYDALEERDSEIARLTMAISDDTRRWSPLNESEILAVMNGMPGGSDGYLKGWGWLTFAQAIEERLRVKNAPEAPLRPDVLQVLKEARETLHQHACHADALADRIAELTK